MIKKVKAPKVLVQLTTKTTKKVEAIQCRHKTVNGKRIGKSAAINLIIEMAEI